MSHLQRDNGELLFALSLFAALVVGIVVAAVLRAS